MCYVLTDVFMSPFFFQQPHGRAWMVLNKDEFLSSVLPQYLVCKKYDSFTRQLNGWWVFYGKWCLPHIVSLDSILTHKWCSALLTSLYLRGFKRLYRPGPGKFFEIYIIYSLLFFCAMTSVLTSTPNLLREISSSRPRKLLSRTFPEEHAWVNMSHTTIAAERWTVNYFSRRRAKWDWCV